MGNVRGGENEEGRAALYLPPESPSIMSVCSLPTDPTALCLTPPRAPGQLLSAAPSIQGVRPAPAELLPSGRGAGLRGLLCYTIHGRSAPRAPMSRGHQEGGGDHSASHLHPPHIQH